jgi:hypothetical protein
MPAFDPENGTSYENHEEAALYHGNRAEHLAPTQEDLLRQLWATWKRDNGFAGGSTEELMYSHGNRMTDAQQAWIQAYDQLWDAATTAAAPTTAEVIADASGMTPERSRLVERVALALIKDEANRADPAGLRAAFGLTSEETLAAYDIAHDYDNGECDYDEDGEEGSPHFYSTPTR